MPRNHSSWQKLVSLFLHSLYAMNTLLSFVGFNDPFSKPEKRSTIESYEGPVLSLLNLRAFDRLIIFSTDGTRTNAVATVEEAVGQHPSLIVEHIPLSIVDPTHYASIFAELRRHLHQIRDGEVPARFFISPVSGTPEIHACWLFLQGSGEFPATILHTRPEKFADHNAPRLQEIDLTAPEFPTIRYNFSHISAAANKISLLHLEKLVAEVEMVGHHPNLKQLQIDAVKIAATDYPILITGESGTGKELLARLVHNSSPRRDQKYVTINCAAIPASLFESELFGYAAKSFTGGDPKGKMGKISTADGGTLFLDEIGEIPIEMQPKLLRFLQQGEIEVIGGKTQKVDVRIIAATNRDLEKAVAGGNFRADLLHRLAIGLLGIPPLRERRSDIAIVANFILDKHNQEYQNNKRLHSTALMALEKQSWPGNVRQLTNCILRGAILAEKDVIYADDLKLELNETSNRTDINLPDIGHGFSLKDYLTTLRQALIGKALSQTDKRQNAAARLLGISPAALNKFLRNNDLESR